jgi:hypothetical protein
MKIHKFLTAGAALSVALVLSGLSVSGVSASAQTTTTTAAATTTTVPANLPADQLILNGSCIPAQTIFQTAEEAMANYAPGSAPAGVYLNGGWVPAPYMAAFSGLVAVGAPGCVSSVGVPTTIATTTSTT